MSSTLLFYSKDILNAYGYLRYLNAFTDSRAPNSCRRVFHLETKEQRVTFGITMNRLNPNDGII